jgi:hypothetical protein
MKLTVLAVAAALTTVTFAALAHAPKIGSMAGRRSTPEASMSSSCCGGPCCRFICAITRIRR